MMNLYFQYGETEINYLKQKDKKMAEAIERIGFIKREIDPDLFRELVHTIVGQQISTQAQATVWGRLTALVPDFTAEQLCCLSAEQWRTVGVSSRKMAYIHAIAEHFRDHPDDWAQLAQLPDQEVCHFLIQFKGVGLWTAEMLLLFSLHRQNILSFGDLAIRRGLRMLYRHRDITPSIFQKYQKRFSPYGSVASLYLWEIAGGALPDLMDTKKKA